MHRAAAATATPIHRNPIRTRLNRRRRRRHVTRHVLPRVQLQAVRALNAAVDLAV